MLISDNAWFLTPKSGHTDEDHLKMVGNDVLENQNRNQEKKEKNRGLGASLREEEKRANCCSVYSFLPERQGSVTLEVDLQRGKKVILYL